MAMQIIQVNAEAQLDAYRDFDPDYRNFIDPLNLSVIRVSRGSIVKMYAGSNTLSLFQKFGGVNLSWCEVGRNGMLNTRPIGRDDCTRLILNMTTWLAMPQAIEEMRAVKTDPGYVQDMIDEFAKLLAPDASQTPDHVFNTWKFLTVEGFHNDDRELAAMCELVDEYSDQYWGECADH